MSKQMSPEQRVHELERQNSELLKERKTLREENGQLKMQLTNLKQELAPKHSISLEDVEEGLDAEGGWSSPTFSLRNIEGLSLRFFPRGRGEAAGTGHSSAFLVSSESGIRVRAKVGIDSSTKAFEGVRTIEAGEESGWTQFGKAQEKYGVAVVQILDVERYGPRKPRRAKAAAGAKVAPATAAAEAVESPADETEVAPSSLDELDESAASQLLDELPGTSAAAAAAPETSPQGAAAA